jgi:hypothetical protein
MRKIILAACLLLAAFLMAQGQVSVSLSPVPAMQFLPNTGAPLASGCVYTFQSGTSTQLATYSDGLGTIVNGNPVVLDGGGFAVIFLKNAAYRFTIYSKGLGGSQGSDCFSGTFQRTVDNVSAYSVINQSNNLFLFGAASDPSGTAGELAYRTDIPCFRGFTTTWDCFVRLTDTQTLTNKTADISLNTLKNSTNTAGHYPRNNGTQYVDSTLVASDAQSTYVNEAVTGTAVNRLAQLAGPGTVNTPGTGVTSGVIGICASGCGTTGSAQIASSGILSCQFDGATTANDYVQIS